MMKHNRNFAGRWGLPLLLGVTALAQPLAHAQEADTDAAPKPEVAVATGPIEEVVVIGRYRAAATDVLSERIESDVPMDFLDAESISRLGDSDVAAALRRVPGLTLVDDKFVYVRGLGERYSSTQLNGASVPSPDLTRNVLPLDIFPAEIIDALEVQKGYSPEQPAAFGGGNVNIRTKKVPEDAVFSVTVKSGRNFDSDNGFTYNGGSDDNWGTDDGTRKLSRDIAQGIDTYEGSFAPQNILTVLNRDGQYHTLAEAEAINRELTTGLNRNIDLKKQSLDPDLSGEITGGYRWFLGDDLEVGFLALGAYDNQWRNKDRVNRRVVNPETDYSKTERTINEVNLTASLNLGARFTEDHEIGTVSMYLRNTEDEAATSVSCLQGQFNDCGDTSSPAQGRLSDVRFEERELELNQIFGEHKLGDATLDKLPEWLSWAEKLRDLSFSWYYSDAKAKSDIPNEARYSFVESLDPGTGDILNSLARPGTTTGLYRFSEFKDDVESYGYDLTLPLFGDGWDLELSGGWDYARKGRDYTQTSIGIGSTAADFLLINNGLPSEVFSDANVLDPDYGINISLGVGGFGTESYFAGQIVEGAYGKFDLLLNDTWRLSGGARWENFQQVSVPVDLLAYATPRIPLTAEEIAQSAINDDDWYPSLALTYIHPGFWSDEFQLRFAYSQTVARPDLREISQSQYIDPLTEARVRGNAFLSPSDLTNYDVRGEWYWDNGDNLTVSLFYKDIDSPIETVEVGATEDNVLFSFVNGETAWVYGTEVEWLKGLGFASNWVGNWIDAFYLAGNFTLSDSEIEIPPGPGVGNITNDKRRLSQQSQWVTNVQIGYDSPNGKHGATLAYNAFGERVYFAGTNGIGDAMEQPFHSLDFVYQYFPTENVTLKLRLKNLLDESVEIEQNGVKVIEQSLGVTALVDFKWEM
ncbi:MAG: TonB-dependent receptor plug domain-containing protein [Pseudomonadales bacterium]